MKTMAVVLAALALAACAKVEGPESTANVSDPGFQYELRAVDQGHQAKGRFYFIHGMGQHIADLKTSQWARLADFMHTHDYEVIYIGWNWIDGTAMTNQGQDYMTFFQDWIVALNTSLPPMPKTVIGGASMGGWHSIIASEVIQHDAIVAIEPVVYLPILWPFAGYDASKTDIKNHLLPANMFVTVGLSDTSVGWWLERSVLSSVPEYHEYVGEIHGPYADQYDDVMAWLLPQI